MEAKLDVKGQTQGPSNFQTHIIAIKADTKYRNWSYW